MSDGDTITAALFNNEYNQLVNAFAYHSSTVGSTGHRHDGTAGHGGNIHTIGDLDFLNKIVADSTNNRWGVFVEVSSAAVEQIRIADGVVSPVTDNDIDLGTSSLEFKDAYFDGTITTDGLTVSSTTNLDGAIQVDNTITVGVDDTGYDVKFFGDTASAYMLWDTSTDDLVLAGAAGLDIAGDIDVDGTANLDVVDIDGAVDMASTLTLAGNADFNGDLDVDGTTNLDNTDIDGTLAVDGTTISLDATTSFNIDNSNTSNGITIGTATSGVPVSIGHATSEVTVNDNLTVTGTLTLGSGAELTEAELEMLDGITAGTVTASKAVVVDSNKDIGTFRNVTIDGTFSDGNYTFDTSGNVSGLGTIGSGAITSTGTVQGTTITATTAFVPDASDGAALGTSALEFSDLFLADGAVINFGDDQDVSLTHVADTGLLISSTDQLQFGDSGTYIYQSADGVLDLVSDTEIEINATTIDMNGNLDLSGSLTMGSAAISEADIEQIDDLTAGTVTASKAVVVDSNKDIGSFRNITLTGELDAATLDISGAIDIAGASQFNSTVTVGVDDTGYDVKFFGATASAYMLWDESVDDLILAGAARVVVPDGQLVLGSTAVSSTAAELNIMDGDTSASSTTLADADRVVVNDNGTMKQVALTDFETYFESAIDTFSTIDINGGSIDGATLGTNSAITQAVIDDIDLNGKVITMTGSASDTAVFTAGTNGTLSIVTTDAAAAAANIQITADGTAELAGTTVTLDSGGGITLDADSGTITFADGGSSLGTITSSGYSGTAAVATAVTITDNESTNENNAVIFTAGGDLDGGNLGLESDGDLTYNPSTGLLSSTGVTASGTVTYGSLSDGSITITAFVDEDNMASDSATLVPTQQSVKAYVDNNAGTMTSFQLEDDDGTEVAISNAKEVKFIGSGVTTNWTDTSTGSDGDPYDLTFTVDAAQTGITSVLNTSLVVGRDADNDIDFATDNKIIIRAAAADQITIEDGVIAPVTNNDIDLGSDSLEFKNAWFDGTLETDNLTIGGAQGSDGQVLTSTGSGVGWEDASGGGISGLDGLVENNSVWLGNDPSSTTSTASNSVGLGVTALDAITTGDGNTAVGYDALTSNTIGFDNVAVGWQAMSTNIQGDRNTGVGVGALFTVKGDYNTGVGYHAGYPTTTGANNTSLGFGALETNTTGTGNVAIGYQSLDTSNADDNVAVGWRALFVQTTATKNVGVGDFAGATCTTNGSNVFIGANAGETAGTTHTNSVFIGADCGTTEAIDGAKQKQTVIGAGAQCGNVEQANVIGGSNTSPGSNWTSLGTGSSSQVAVNHSSGTAWTFPSDERMKENIADMPDSAGLAFINVLKPRTFEWRKVEDYDDSLMDITGKVKKEGDTSRKSEGTQYGFIAQEAKTALETAGITPDGEGGGFGFWTQGGDLEESIQKVAKEDLIPSLVKAIQELSAKVDALESS